jgi:hypothetical protein
VRDVIFIEGDFREYYINDLYTTHAVVCWLTIEGTLGSLKMPNKEQETKVVRAGTSSLVQELIVDLTMVV